ncbi:MAG TPA: 30S ribosomal protein S6 [Bacteroidota bacterium]|nr:30S ribosomal protein S6 [Bacteroidota bacterium]
MSISKRLYETTCIINASLEDSQIEATIAHLSEVIIRNGGELVATNRWGRKRLAYPIEKKNNGFYVNMEFLANGPVIKQLDRTYTLDENILRFLTVQLDTKAVATRQAPPAPAPRVEQATPVAAPPPPPEPAKEPLFADDDAPPAA